MIKREFSPQREREREEKREKELIDVEINKRRFLFLFQVREQRKKFCISLLEFNVTWMGHVSITF